MKLFTYGDSWTEGQGVNPQQEDGFQTREERKKYRNDRSWPIKLSKLLNCECVNQSISGVGNNFIFNKVILDIKSEIVKPSDFIIIMWSSSLRDDVPFFPNGEWHAWGDNYISETNKKKWFVFNEKVFTNNPSYNQFLIKFKEFYIDELYYQNYYNIVNQNYIIFLQKLFEYYQINYLFCDAFDKMVDGISNAFDKTHIINKYNYWGFGEKTFKDYLVSTNNKMVWENPQYNILEIPGMHPSELGYKLISEELYLYIESRPDLLSFKNKFYNNKKIL
jgi:lysophospholipase L1-like esterase